LLPLFGFCISSLFGRFIGKKGSAIVVIFFMACTIVLSTIGFYYVGLENNIFFIDLGM
jgi:NADH:ubiquinone oxidoreductase subunit 5 (subunit L)/multisubunit Na+/H+ antiporter MnhA subunit